MCVQFTSNYVALIMLIKLHEQVLLIYSFVREREFWCESNEKKVYECQVV